MIASKNIHTTIEEGVSCSNKNKEINAAVEKHSEKTIKGIPLSEYETKTKKDGIIKKMMHKVFGIFFCITMVLVACKPAVGGNDSDEVIEETKTETPAETPKKDEPKVPPYNPWIEVIADESSETGIGYFFIDSRVSNPLADLVADEQIKLESVGTKTNNRADRYFGPSGDGAETITVYKVFVNKDKDYILNRIYLEDESLIATSEFGSGPFHFKISKNENVWVMALVNTIYDSPNDRALKFFNTYYE